MKSALILVILVFGINLYGQTDSIEKGIIKRRLTLNLYTQKEYSKVLAKWEQSVAKVKKYPSLPLDPSGQIYYSFQCELKNMTKEKIFNRAFEWLAITYGVTPGGLYSNVNDGKIILYNSMDLDIDNTCTYTYIITIRDEKILIEFIRVRFKMFQVAHNAGGTWIPDGVVNFDISKVYPIISKEPSEWDIYLGLLRATDDYFNREVRLLCEYIMTYDTNYKF
jgi:hypothetical protein